MGLAVFEMLDGVLQSAPPGFDPDKATAAQLTGVARVLIVGKVLVPQTRLVATKEVKKLMGKAKDSGAEPPGEGKVGKTTGAKRQPSRSK